jgi:hypothetical protein
MTMADSAHVTSTEAIARFEAALVRFGDDAGSALLSLDQQINRALDWLDNEAPAYWRRQIRSCFDEVARTRTAWENCMLRTVAGDRPSCLEEEQAHRAAKRRLEVAVRKPEEVRAWAIKVHREVDEYRGRIGRLRHCLEADVPKTIALLERTRMILEEYAGRRAGDAGEPDSSAAERPEG